MQKRKQALVITALIGISLLNSQAAWCGDDISHDVNAMLYLSIPFGKAPNSNKQIAPEVGFSLKQKRLENPTAPEMAFGPESYDKTETSNNAIKTLSDFRFNLRRQSWSTINFGIFSKPSK